MAATAARTRATDKPAETPAAPETSTAPETPDVPETKTVTIKFDAETLTKIKTARAWRPKDGDTIRGNIVTVVRRTGEYGPYPCVIMRLDGADAFTAVHAFHGVLQNELKDMRAKPGDEITVLYTGKRTANKLNTDGSEKHYHGYSVVPTDGLELEVFDFTGE